MFHHRRGWRLGEAGGKRGASLTGISDQIYRAGARPELWPEILQVLSVHVGAKGSLLLAATAESTRCLATGPMAPLIRELTTWGWKPKYERMARVSATPGFTLGHDLYDVDDFKGAREVLEAVRPSGQGASVAAALHTTSDSILIILLDGFASVAEATAAIPVLNGFYRDLVWVCGFSCTVRLERARATLDALEMAGSAAAIVNASGVPQATNGLFDASFNLSATGARTRFKLGDEEDDKRLADALARVGPQSDERLIPVRPKAGGPPRVLRVLPLPTSSQDVFFDAAAVLIVSTPRVVRPLSVEMLKRLFDLTPAEARLTHSLAQGKTLREAADALKVSHHTVRNQIKSVFSKTGSSRQADLLMLLRSLTGEAA